jgi:uncharacterized hydantoinase/oxoprolinase family protein
VYTGAVRTPVEVITSHVPRNGRTTGVSAEAFALAGDVHVWRGQLTAEDYSAPTPDGRPATREFVRERLARIVCADREMLDDTAISASRMRLPTHKSRAWSMESGRSSHGTRR